ncbi:conserved hypothetical protein [Ketogulonicigenium vulgare Y25]|uniref:nuclear transport factor 2 family protein n=1 Tax=Ketogulonicigenium vulgare TaxID=92945 RepID=UPI0001E6748E|nr:nuclear transport factor 2 family protein [Ketogulonicigenium vulgare]ADO43180.1 conserved hypothetical protein [Ketogulonicigenium vulgare Y25]
MKKLIASFAIAASIAAPVFADTEVRPGVFFAGTVETAGSDRAVMQDLIFDLATAWAVCDRDAMANAITDDVSFSYPTSAVNGREAIMADLEAFCGAATDTSLYFPARPIPASTSPPMPFTLTWTPAASPPKCNSAPFSAATVRS